MVKIEDLEDLACEAGQAILAIYRLGKIEVQQKDDHSPVTQADLLANNIICQGLRALASMPIISEEGSGEPDLSKQNPKAYWLVDPLDGTKEFIARRPTFTVNIALIEDGIPIAGVIYAPDREELYAGDRFGLRINRQLSTSIWSDQAVVAVCSASRVEPEFASFELRNKLRSVVRIGSSIKFCLIASGAAHYYPRFQSLSAWDIAAGHAIALAAGCSVNQLGHGQPLSYAYAQRWSPGFIVQAPGFKALL